MTIRAPRDTAADILAFAAKLCAGCGMTTVDALERADRYYYPGGIFTHTDEQLLIWGLIGDAFTRHGYSSSDATCSSAELLDREKVVSPGEVLAVMADEIRATTP